MSRSERANGGKASRKKKDICLEKPFPLFRSSRISFEDGIDSVVRLLQDKKRIVVLTGAGISVSCGIPDFRTKGTGLYSTLDPHEYGLQAPEDIFCYEQFQEDPRPFYAFARSLYFPLGTEEKVRPSDSHKLIALLEQNRQLLRVYTQNIDGLEEVAGVSPKKVVYAHGSLQYAKCLRCQQKVPASEIEKDILHGSVAYCQVPKKGSSARKQPASRESSRQKRPRHESPAVCNGVLKPGVTFFGEPLSQQVRRYLEADRDKVDALIVIGTSLSVAPISKVIDYLPTSIPRILINRTIVHPAHSPDEEDPDDEEDFRDNYVFDAYLLGFCDDVTRVLAKQLFAQESVDFRGGRLLAKLSKRDKALFDVDEWSETRVPRERVFLFPGAQAVDDVDVEYREVAHCDGCQKRIRGVIQKCADCFDYDLCEICYPRLSKNHFNGEHTFCSERAATKAT